MLAPANAIAPSSTSQLLSLGRAAELTGLDPQALRRLADRPNSPIRTIVLSSGHRRFVRSSLTSLIAPCAPDESADTVNTEAIPVLLLARVSSEGQAKARGSSDASDLDRQIERLREYCREHYPNAKVYESIRVASGCNFRSKELHDALRLIWSGKLKGGVLIATYFDRVLRIGWELVELACEEFGVEVVYINSKSDDENPQKEMIDELLAIMTLYTARASGAKTRDQLKIFMTPEILKRTWKLYCSGVPVRAIVEMYEKEGIKDEKGRAYKRHVVFKLIEENRTQLTALYGTEGEETSFTKFLNHFVVETGDVNDVLERRTILRTYREWCEANGQEFLTDNKTCLEVAKRGWELKPQHNRRRAFYVGVRLGGVAAN